MVDKIDLKLLYELDKNCRQSIAQIAKKLRIHRNVALYRIQNLEKQGIIKNYFTELNNIALGYQNYRVFIKLGNTSLEQEQELIKYIKETKQIIWLFKVIGKWDLDLVYTSKTPQEFYNYLKILMQKFNQIIEEKQISQLIQIYHFPKDYLITNNRTKIERKTLDYKNHKLNNEDINLIKVLANNARIGIIELSKKSGLSINTIKKKIKILKEEGIILGFKPFIDTEKLGYNYYKIHINLKNYTLIEWNKFKAYLETKPNIVYLDQYISGEDFEIELHLKNEHELLSFIQDLKSNFGNIIKNYYTIKFYEQLIFRYYPEN